MIKKGIRTNHRVPFYLHDKIASMYWRTIKLFLVIATLSCQIPICAQTIAKSNQTELSVSPIKGKAPLTVVLSGPGTYYIGATLLKPGPSDEMMPSYAGSAIVTVEGWGSSAKVSPKNSDPFYRCLQMAPRYVRLKKNNKATPKTATLLLTQKVPPNFEYCIDWGDGSVEQQEAPPRSKNSAKQLRASTKVISHTYKVSGKYRVRLKTNNDEPSRKARDITYYECFDISI